MIKIFNYGIYKKLFKRFYGALIVLFVCSCMEALDVSLGAYVLKRFINMLSSMDLRSESMNEVLYPTLSLISMPLLSFLCWRSYEYFIQIKALPQMREFLCMEINTLLLQQNYRFFNDFATGALGYKIRDLINKVPEIIPLLYNRLVFYILTLMIAFGFLSNLAYKYGLVMIIWSLVFICVVLLNGKNLIVFVRDISKKNVTRHGYIFDVFNNILACKLFAKEEQELIYLKNQSQIVKKGEQRLAKTYFKIFLFYGLSYLISYVLITLELLRDYKQNLITIGDFALVLGITQRINGILWHFILDFTKIYRLWGTIDDANNVLLAKMHKILPKEPLVLKNYSIVFNKVNFTHSNASTPLFNNLNLHIKHGQRVALVGESGVVFYTSF